MLNSLFIENAERIFGRIKEDYNFSVEKGKNFLRYYREDATVDFCVCFERYLEIYVVFNLKEGRLRLNDILEWSNSSVEQKVFVNRNQILKKEQMNKFLKKLAFVTKEVIERIQKDQYFLVRCFNEQRIYEEKRRKELENYRTIAKLNELWRLKEYEKFLNLFYSIEKDHAVCDSCKIKKQVLYAQRKLLQTGNKNTGDGSKNTGDGSVC